MTKTMGDETFLSRWSRRKHASAREPVAPVPSDATVVAPPASRTAPATPAPAAFSAPVDGSAPVSPATSLPPVDALTFESDFTPFLRPGVDASLRRSALRTLLHDPRFNVMDGLDVYIDDYTKPAPLQASVVAGMVQARYIFSPPSTRVNADGIAVDVPETVEPVERVAAIPAAGAVDRDAAIDCPVTADPDADQAPEALTRAPVNALPPTTDADSVDAGCVAPRADASAQSA